MESLNNFALTKQQQEEIQNIVVEQIKMLLPSIIENMIPLIVSKTKELTNIHLERHYNITSDNSNYEKEKRKIIDSQRKDWNISLDKRENLFWKHHRSSRLIELYTDCLNKEEIYIPKKFREDKRHIRDQEESPVIKQLELQRFQAEHEILRIRMKNFELDLSHLDNEVKNSIIESTSNVTLQEHLFQKYQHFCQIDVNRITTIWDKKIESLKKSFQEDENNMKPLTTFNQSNHEIDVLATDSQPTEIEETQDLPEIIEVPSTPENDCSKNLRNQKDPNRRKRNTRK